MKVFECSSAALCVSCVDVTFTGVTRGSGVQRNQQRNWETVVQTVGLLSQPIIAQYPEKLEFTNDEDFNSSALYRLMGSKHRFVLEFLKPDVSVWMFAVASEHADVFGKDCELLNRVFDYIPVIGGLEETIDLKPSVFSTTDPEFINIQFFPAMKS